MDTILFYDDMVSGVYIFCIYHIINTLSHIMHESEYLIPKLALTRV